MREGLRWKGRFLKSASIQIKKKKAVFLTTLRVTVKRETSLPNELREKKGKTIELQEKFSTSKREKEAL